MLTAINPANASAGAATLVLTVSGSGFLASSQVLWNGAGLTTTYTSPTSLTAQVPGADLAAAGTASVAVQTPGPGGGVSPALSFSISVPPNPVPTVAALSPASANAGSAAFVLTVTGSGFAAGSQVLWNGAALSTTYVSGTSLTASVPASDLVQVGMASVSVLTPAPGGGSSAALPFAVNAPPNPVPSVTVLMPSSADAGSAAVQLAVTGSGFTSSSVVLWNGAALMTSYISATGLAAQVPAADLKTAGTASVTVQTPAPGGGVSGAATFTVSTPPNAVPVLSGLSPTSAEAGSAAFALTVTGSGFSSSSLVLWNGAALVTQYGSATLLTAQVPPGDLKTAGPASVTVQTPSPGGGVSGAATFTVSTPPNAVPVLSALSPASVEAGSAAFTLAVTGSGFASSSVVLWNGAALPTQYGSATSLMAQVPPSDVGTAGTASVTVQTPAPGGGVSAALVFTVSTPPNAAPALSAISPTSADSGGAALTLTVTGTGFVSGSQVLWNGAALVTTYVSATSLTALVPAADLANSGTATVTVTTPAPGGGSSAGVAFTINTPPNAAPVLGGISPSSDTAGGAPFTLSVSGSGFAAGSQVLWNGVALVTSYQSATMLTAQVPAADLANAGDASVSVQTSAPGGGTSASLVFAIVSPVTVPTAVATVRVLPVEGNDLAWDAAHGRLYVATSSKTPTNPNAIVSIDPVAGAVTAAQTLSTEPMGVGLSSDDQMLYAVVNGSHSIQRFLLPALTPDISWSLGNDPTFGKPYLIGELQVQPGAAHTVAVSYGQYGDGFIGVFDDGVERAGIASDSDLPSSLQWKTDGTALYATGGSVTDAGYYASYSNIAVYVLPVAPQGFGTFTVYDSAFQEETARLLSDPATGILYGSGGEGIREADGVSVGWFNGPHGGTGGIAPGPIGVVDSALGRFYKLQEVKEYGSDPLGEAFFEIRTYDLKSFQMLGSIVIPADAGDIQAMVRWGQAGLAFLATSGAANSVGNLYLVDGSFVNAAVAPDTSAGTPIAAVPLLEAMSPAFGAAGSGAQVVTVSGHGFTNQTTVFWNGMALPTTVLSNTTVSVQVPATDLASSGQFTVTASNSGALLPGSNALTFAVDDALTAGEQMSIYPLGGNNLVWDANRAKLYVSVPGVQGDAGDAIAVVDPATGAVTSTSIPGGEPDRLSLSSDGQFLYAGLDAQNAIAQFSLPDFALESTWTLGGQTEFDGPFYALDLEAAPGSPQTTAVTLAQFRVSPSSAGLEVFDGSTPRPELQSARYEYEGLQWGISDAQLYAVDQSSTQAFLALSVSAAGPALSQAYPGLVSPYSYRMHFDPASGLIYTDGGQAIQPSNGSTAGTFNASGLVAVDAPQNRVYILGQTAAQANSTSYTVEAFDKTTYAALGSMVIENVVGTPSGFVRWGSDGLAFTTRVGHPWDFEFSGPGQLYVLQGTFVTAAAGAGQNSKAAVERTWDPQGAKRQQEEKVVHGALLP